MKTNNADTSGLTYGAGRGWGSCHDITGYNLYLSPLATFPPSGLTTPLHLRWLREPSPDYFEFPRQSAQLGFTVRNQALVEGGGGSALAQHSL